LASKIQIINAALAQLGAPTITSLGDNTTSANLMADLYDIALDSVLSAAAWTPVTKRAELALLDITPDFGYTYAYQLPTNPYCLRIIEAYTNECSDFDWRKEGDMLLADANNIAIKYIGRVTETGTFGPYITDTLIAKLAFMAAKSLTGSTNEALALGELYQQVLRTSINADGMQGASDIYTSTDFTRDIR
jgi:hypothetical protein